MFVGDQLSGHHTCDPTAGGESGIGQRPYAARAAAPVHEVARLPRQQFAQRRSRNQKPRRSPDGGTAQHTNATRLHELSMIADLADLGELEIHALTGVPPNQQRCIIENAQLLRRPSCNRQIREGTDFSCRWSPNRIGASTFTTIRTRYSSTSCAAPSAKPPADERPCTKMPMCSAKTSQSVGVRRSSPMMQ